MRRGKGRSFMARGCCHSRYWSKRDDPSARLLCLPRLALFAPGVKGCAAGLAPKSSDFSKVEDHTLPSLAMPPPRIVRSTMRTRAIGARRQVLLRLAVCRQIGREHV